MTKFALPMLCRIGMRIVMKLLHFIRISVMQPA